MGSNVVRVLQYQGSGEYVVGIPARDLLPVDVAEVLEREHISEAAILLTGLYQVVEWVEVAPFCGAEVDEGRCREPVAHWGARCEAHSEAGEEER